ncbi:MAG: hypothetical protein K9J17_14390 [Flavobacteriales bacterium]|nr:hypothetical protein [Flavobacteriales bacterium]
MGKFLEQQKKEQANWKLLTGHLTEQAKGQGYYAPERPYPFCLPLENSDQNLFAPIRDSAIDYFKAHKIKWHDHIEDKPSSHLCDSQVCCVNLLMSLNISESVLVKLFQRYFPDIRNTVPMDADSIIALEWIGLENYLGEKTKGKAERTRGANFTSVDGAVMFETASGKRIIVLIEWKYCESYGSTSYKISKNGTDRTTIYSHLWEKEPCPIDKAKVPSFDSLFFEPFYQFTRQQFLAHEMELAKEFGADKVYLMHLSPQANTDFQRITSKELSHLGDSATHVWKNLQTDPDKFIPVYTEDFFDKKIILSDPKMHDYWEYISSRYKSILNI